MLVNFTYKMMCHELGLFLLYLHIGLSEHNDGIANIFTTLVIIIKFNFFFLDNFSLGLMRWWREWTFSLGPHASSGKELIRPSQLIQ